MNCNARFKYNQYIIRAAWKRQYFADLKGAFSYI